MKKIKSTIIDKFYPVNQNTDLKKSQSNNSSLN